MSKPRSVRIRDDDPEGRAAALKARNKMRASLHGEDKFGKFKIVPGECKVCDEFAICVHYKETPRVSDYVKQARSFVLRIKNRGGKPQLHRRVGISCGCYAKAHRQVAHISGVNPQTGERLD